MNKSLKQSQVSYTTLMNDTVHVIKLKTRRHGSIYGMPLLAIK
jgi:hypothetical protein